MAQERVLIIEHGFEVRQLFAGFVAESRGCQLLAASDGEQGLGMALQERPDIIVLDMQLAEMNGLEVLEALQQRGVDIPVIFTTSGEHAELAMRAFRLGACDYVVRPCGPREMREAIQRARAANMLRQERDQLAQQLLEANQRHQRQLQELNMIYTVGQSVTSLLDLNRVLNRVVDIAVYVAQAEEGMLMLLDGKELYLRAAREMDERATRTLHVRVDDSIAGRALRAGRPILLAGEGARVPTGYLVKALLYLPLRVPGRGLIGVLGVVNREAEHSFSERDIFLLSGLADYAAIAIENARLFETVKLERGKLQAVLREAQEPIVIVDEEDHVLLCSAAACAVLDLVTADVLGQPVDAAIPHLDLREMFAQVAQTGRVAHREVSFQGRRTFNAQLAPVTGVGRVLVMQDITHLKELDRVKSEFVATISHDLRTPLTSILGYIDLLSRVGPLNAQQRTFIQHVSESTDAITRLISGLLDIGRIEAGLDLEMEPCDLVDIIDAAVGDLRPQAEEKGLEVRWRSPEMLSPVQGNPRRLRQVMDNLLANAVKYTHAGGWVSVSAVEEAGYILVHVADNGVGIPLEQQPYIFDKLCRVDSDDLADAAGSRLGLAIVKAVIARHNGRIWVESRPGVGSTFSFILPAMRA